MSKKHIGSSFDDFLREEGIYEEVHTQAVKRVLAWQIAETKKLRASAKAKWRDACIRTAANSTASLILTTTV